MSDSHQGTCFCGAVTVEVIGDPVAEGFCHCNDCRAWSGTPVTAYALWPSAQVTIAGEIDSYTRTGTTHRKSCAACGSLIAAEIPATGLTDVFPVRLEGRAFRPRAHVHYSARIIDMQDGLPKFADMPTEAGGSGKMIDD